MDLQQALMPQPHILVLNTYYKIFFKKTFTINKKDYITTIQDLKIFKFIVIEAKNTQQDILQNCELDFLNKFKSYYNLDATDDLIFS